MGSVDRIDRRGRTQVGYNIFCSGLTLLADGRLFVGGGHISNNVGLNDASIYDGATNTWSRQPDMNAGRWYPTTTTLADGSVLVVSGDVDTTVDAIVCRRCGRMEPGAT